MKWENFGVIPMLARSCKGSFFMMARQRGEEVMN